MFHVTYYHISLLVYFWQAACRRHTKLKYDKKTIFYNIISTNKAQRLYLNVIISTMVRIMNRKT